MTDPAMAFTDRAYHKRAPVPSGPRPGIHSFRRPAGADDLGAFFDQHLPLPRDGRVLDAGCGPGQYLPAARARLSEDATLVALDISHIRLTGIGDAPTVTGDVQALPFPDGAFDVVLAMHMLYHVPDIPAAVREFHRVLVPDGGVLHAFTNSERADWELTELYLRNGGDDNQAMGDARFSNESGGALLRTAFDDVTLVELTDTWLEVTDPECVVDAIESLRYTLEPGLRPDVTWAELITGARRDAYEVVEREGAFRMSENHGLFTCRR